MKKVLWFSRHTMSEEQLASLPGCEINQINRTISHASELSEAIAESDIIAIVAPLPLQREFLLEAGDKPVITAINRRVLVPNPEGGEDKVEFQFDGWKRLVKIEVVTEDWSLV